MRILLVLAALFTLAGCESMDFTSLTVSSGYSNYYPPTTHISYTLGYYTGGYYNGYRVYGTHGHRYYHAPRNYRHHRHFSRPVVVHRHVHTSYCEHNYRPRNHYTPPVVRNTPRHVQPRHVQPRTIQPRHVQPRRTPPVVTPHHTPPRPQVHNDRRNDRDVDRDDRREDRQDRRRDNKRKRK